MIRAQQQQKALGFQLCLTKQLRDSTAEPGDGLEAKPALAPGKSLHRGSRCSQSASSGSSWAPGSVTAS